MLADQLDYIVGVDPHRMCTRSRSSRSSGGVVRGAIAASTGGYRPRSSSGGARARSACVRGRGQRLLRRRPDPLPNGRGETVFEVGRCGGSAVRAARPMRSTRSGPPESCSRRSGPRSHVRRRTGGAAGVDGRPRRSRQRPTGRALPAARPDDHHTRAAAQRAAAVTRSGC